MPAFVTQTLDENLEWGLISLTTNPHSQSSLREFVGMNLSSEEESSVQEFSLPDVVEVMTNNTDFFQRNWYRIVLFLEPSSLISPENQQNFIYLKKFLEAYKSATNNASFSPNKVRVVINLNTALKNTGANLLEWQKELNQEKIWGEEILKYIDKSSFILIKELFYDRSLLKKYVQENHFDPDLNFTFITPKTMAMRIKSFLIRPSKKTILLQGQSRKSTLFLKEMSDFQGKVWQKNVSYQKHLLQETPHPLVVRLARNIQTSIISEEKSVLINNWINNSLETLEKEKRVTESFGFDEEPSSLPTPQKKSLIASWNQVVIEPKKINLNLERDISVKKATVSHQKSSVEKMVDQEQMLKQKSEHSAAQEENKKKTTDSTPFVNQFFNQYRQAQKKHHLRKLSADTKVGFRKLRHQKILFGGGLLVTLLAGAALLLISLFFISLSSVQENFLEYVSSRELITADREIKKEKLVTQVKRLQGVVDQASEWFPLGILTQAEQVLMLSDLSLELESDIRGYEEKSTQFYQQTMGQEIEENADEGNTPSSLTTKSFEDLNSELKQASGKVLKNLSLLSAELKNFNQNALTPEQKNLINEYQKQLQSKQQKLTSYQQLAPLLPQILGEKEDKTYLVVLQNNQELRPTGGFIQAVAFLNFSQGELVSIQVEDVYSLDQQLKATLSPPAEVKKYLGEERWFLRDSNWSPDFVKTAEQVRWFIAKSVGVKIDGVIGLNLNSLSALIGSIDEVELSEYNEVLTKKNLAERMEFHSEVQLVDPVNKKDYSELVLYKALIKLQNIPQDQVQTLFSTWQRELEDKEILLAAFNDEVAQTLEALGWSGSQISPTCPSVFATENCVVDQLMQVEANIGVNKANYYLDRQINHSIMVGKNQITHKRVINYKNKAQSNAWPKGPYRAFTRFYLPENIDLESVEFNGQKIALNQLNLKKSGKLLVLGVPLEVPVNSELEVVLNYSLPYGENTPFTYTFFEQKQSGVNQPSPRIFLSYHPDLSPTLIAPQAEVQNRVIVFDPSEKLGHTFVGASFE